MFRGRECYCSFRVIISVTLLRSLVTFIVLFRSRLGRVVPDELVNRSEKCFTVRFRLSSYGLRVIFKALLTDYQRY